MGALASVGIPMAISLLPKLFGAGLQVDSRPSTGTRNVYVPPLATGEGNPYFPPPFIGNWENPVGMGLKKKSPKERD